MLALQGMPPLSPEKPALCAGCGGKISDRYYLLAVDKQWHLRCLKCCECKLALESELTCFAKDGSIYCKEDYYRYSRLYLSLTPWYTWRGHLPEPGSLPSVRPLSPLRGTVTNPETREVHCRRVRAEPPPPRAVRMGGRNPQGLELPVNSTHSRHRTAR